MVGVFGAVFEAAPGSLLDLAGDACDAFMPCGISSADGGTPLVACVSAGAAFGGSDEGPTAHASMAVVGHAYM